VAVDEYRIGRSLAGASRPTSFLIVALAYVLGGLAAWAVAATMAGRAHPIVATLLADVVATLAVFAVSMVVANASVYDPYWSVAPPVIAVAWAVHGDGLPLREIVVVALVLAWAVRLTAHWAGTWRGLSHEDWRYVDLRAGRGRLPWWFVNLGGIQMMPTLVVFLGLLSVWPVMTVGERPFGPLDVLAVLVTLAAIAIEAAADIQLHRFAADPARRGGIADRGLWRLCRHPNYLGEIAFWWGLWLFALAAAPSWWWTVIGPVAMVVLFLTASIPLMDRRSMARRPGYAEWMTRVPALIPLPRRRRSA
jgi:steroid 5-alpha reductase family enzyme